MTTISRQSFVCQSTKMATSSVGHSCSNRHLNCPHLVSRISVRCCLPFESFVNRKQMSCHISVNDSHARPIVCSVVCLPHFKFHSSYFELVLCRLTTMTTAATNFKVIVVNIFFHAVCRSHGEFQLWPKRKKSLISRACFVCFGVERFSRAQKGKKNKLFRLNFHSPTYSFVTGCASRQKPFSFFSRRGKRFGEKKNNREKDWTFFVHPNAMRSRDSWTDKLFSFALDRDCYFSLSSFCFSTLFSFLPLNSMPNAIFHIESRQTKSDKFKLRDKYIFSACAYRFIRQNFRSNQNETENIFFFFFSCSSRTRAPCRSFSCSYLCKK